jgi:hypothetical protein
MNINSTTWIVYLTTSFLGFDTDEEMEFHLKQDPKLLERCEYKKEFSVPFNFDPELVQYIAKGIVYDKFIEWKFNCLIEFYQWWIYPKTT